MKKIEYKTVEYEPGIGTRSDDYFGESFKRVLSEHGQEGWDLKDVVVVIGVRPLLVFGREVA